MAAGGTARLDALPQPLVHKIFDMLELYELARMAQLSKRWNVELDNDVFWAARYIADLGMPAFQRLMEELRDAEHSSEACAWSIKQRLIWQCFCRVDAGFEVRRNVWVCIMRESQRKGRLSHGFSGLPPPREPRSE